MQTLLSNKTTTITELKEKAGQIIKNLSDQPVAILKNNVADAYLVPANLLEKLTELAEDIQDWIECEKRKNEPSIDFDYMNN